MKLTKIKQLLQTIIYWLCDDFVIVGRNQENSKFITVPKKYFNDGEYRDWFEKQYVEKDIVKMIMIKKRFYTFSEKYTKILVVRGHLRTTKNKRCEDNIDKLPIMIN